MKRNWSGPILLIILLTASGFTNSRYVWHKTGYGINESDVHTLAVYDNHHSFLLAGTSKALYKANLDSKEFKSVLEVRASDKAVNSIFISPNFLSPSEPSLIFTATSSGLFLSKDEAKTWERIFYSNQPSERQCERVAADENNIYVATLGGLFFKDLAGTAWNKVQGELSHTGVYLLTQDEEYLYAATDHEVFRLDKDDQASRKIYSSASQELTADASSTEALTTDTSGTEAETGLPATVRQIKCLTAAKKDFSDLLYVVTTKGIFLSENQGKGWNNFGIQDLPFDSAVSLIVNDDEFYLGTAKGMFRLSDNRAAQIFEGMETNRVNFAATDEDETLYAATDKGLFILTEEKALPINSQIKSFTQEYFLHEPSINAVQKMAVYYAEVNPEKITNWRHQAQLRALMPVLTLDFDKTVQTSTGKDYANAAIGPQDWAVNLKWDIGDLIWSTNQSTIDSRAKDTTGLREDILDQVTRLYFERRRLEVELARQDFGEEIRTDKEMRLAELTALIDGFTGGEFSKKIERSNDKEQNPE